MNLAWIGDEVFNLDQLVRASPSRDQGGRPGLILLFASDAQVTVFDPPTVEAIREFLRANARRLGPPRVEPAGD